MTLEKFVVRFGYFLLIGWPVAVTMAALKLVGMPTAPLALQAFEVGMFLCIAAPVVMALISFERRFAAQPEQKVSRVDLKTDLTHLAMCWFVVGPISQQLVRVVTLGAAGAVSGALGAKLWPSQLPLLVQLALALVVGEFGQYWLHRLGHTTALWRIHATHHGTPQVYWLNSTRFHAFELVLRTLIQSGPLILLGASREVFFIYGAFTAIHGWVQHSNVPFVSGFFDYFMSTPRNHRWHHSTNVKEANNNFGSAVAVWDVVFGTWFSPRDRRFTGPVGIGDMPNFPTGYFQQFLSPFTWEKVLAAQSQQPAAEARPEQRAA